MGIRTAWRRARQTIEQESDERTELAALRARRDVIAVVGPLMFVAFSVLVMAPLGNPTRQTVFSFIVLPVLLATTVVVAWLAQRRHRAVTPERRRATLAQLLIATPVVFAVSYVGMATITWASSRGSFGMSSLWRSLAFGVAVAGVFWLGLYVLYRRTPRADD